ncbi:hypothetical protein cand_030680 [Cryptosporidium andersoni]|uniref:NUP210 Ig-like domain-containing protein n=1 Tax=Cryptosporidium andersoni TaxID=117008 RepID=A0A1J4MN72_9CRYT|nr:hypothetical protein cand_030680 [Cryptosporidium andersoni]
MRFILGNLCAYLCLTSLLLKFKCVRSAKYTIEPALALLPWTSNNVSEIWIRVSEGCFEWKYDITEYLEVSNYEVRIDENGKDCTDAIFIRSLWPFKDIKGIFPIIAIEKYTGEILRSEVHVAKIESINISTSSKRIRLGFLEMLSAVGFDNEVNTFTSLQGVNIEWKINNENIVADSLEGQTITVHGSKVGSSIVSAIVIDSNGLKITETSVVIYVEDPFRVIPYSRQAPFGSIYPIKLIKEDLSDLLLNTNDKEYYKCHISGELSSKIPSDTILDNNYLLIGYPDPNESSLPTITVSCVDKRVEGSSSISKTTVSYPANIKLGLLESDTISRDEKLNKDNLADFIDSYYIKGESLVKQTGMFQHVLAKDELVITREQDVVVQIKLLNKAGKFLSVPKNAEFNIICLKGCENVDIKPFSLDQNYLTSFLSIQGIKVGTSLFTLSLESIGLMKYGQGKDEYLTSINYSFTISVIEPLKITIKDLPVVLHPGNQTFMLHDKLTGGTGNFHFCNQNNQIINIDPYNGNLVTSDVNVGFTMINILDIGILFQTNRNFTTQDLCKDLLKYQILNLPIIVTFLDKISFDANSLDTNSAYIHNNTLYISSTHPAITLEIQAFGSADGIDIPRNPEWSNLERLKYTEVISMSKLSVFNPCKLYFLLSNKSLIANSNEDNQLTTNLQVCRDLLAKGSWQFTFKTNEILQPEFVSLYFQHDKLVVLPNSSGTIYVPNITQIYIFVQMQNHYYEFPALTTSLKLEIYSEINVIPRISPPLQSYINNGSYRIESQSYIDVQLKGGIRSSSSEILHLLEAQILKHGEIEDINLEIVKVDRLLNENDVFRIGCKSLGQTTVKFSTSILDNDFKIATTDTKVYVECCQIDKLKIFWISDDELETSIPCNLHYEDCHDLYIDSTSKHKFGVFAYDSNKEDYPLLSFNNFAVEWYFEDMKESNELSYNFLGDYIQIWALYNESISKFKGISLLASIHSLSEDSNVAYDKYLASIKAILVLPPKLVSPNMIIDDNRDIYKYNESPRWSLLSGTHELGIIYGSGKFNISLTLVNNKNDPDNFLSPTLNYYQEKKEFNWQFLDIFPFHLDTSSFSGTFTLTVMDELILPKYTIKKQIFIGKVARAELVWIGQVNLLGNIDSTNKMTDILNEDVSLDEESNYMTDRLSAIEFQIPFSYYIYLKNLRQYYDPPCFELNCLLSNSAISSFMVILYDENNRVLEPWQNDLIDIQIKHQEKQMNNILNSLDVLDVFQRNPEEDLNIVVNPLRDSKVTYIMNSVKKSNIILTLELNVNSVKTNAINLMVYPDVEVESNSQHISLFPHGSPFSLTVSGGPWISAFNKFTFTWDVSSNNQKVILVRKASQRIIEPLGVIGYSVITVKLLASANSITFQNVVIFKRSIKVFVEFPHKIDILSPDYFQVYVGYPKLYTLVVWTKDENLPPIHPSQLIPSLLTSCKINWNILSSESEYPHNSNISCIYPLYSNQDIKSPKSLIKGYLECPNSLDSYYEFIISLATYKTGSLTLNAKVSCSFSSNSTFDLSVSKNIESLKPIDFISNNLWLISDTLYNITIPSDIEITSYGNTYIKTTVEASQIIHIDTSSKVNDNIVLIMEDKRLKSKFNKTFLPITISEVRNVRISFQIDEQGYYIISILPLNSMGIPLKVSHHFCLQLSIRLPFEEDIKGLQLTQVYTLNTNKINDRTFPSPDLLFEIENRSNLYSFCEFRVVAKSLSLYRRNSTVISSLSTNSASLCLIISIYRGPLFLGSQPFCNFDDTLIHEPVVLSYPPALSPSNQKYKIYVLPGSKVHLNTLEWEIKGIIPSILRFYTLINNIDQMVDIEYAVETEVASILDIPLDKVSAKLVEEIPLDLKDMEFINFSTSFIFITINARVSPIRLWQDLNLKSINLLTRLGIYWISDHDNSKEWRIISSNSSSEFIKMNILNIPTGDSYIGTCLVASLSNIVEFEICITSFKSVMTNLVSSNSDSLFLDNPWVFEIIPTIKETKSATNSNNFSFSWNPIYSNLFYTSPIYKFHCNINQDFLNRLYTTESYWKVYQSTSKSYIIVPSCSLIPKIHNSKYSLSTLEKLTYGTKPPHRFGILANLSSGLSILELLITDDTKSYKNKYTIGYIPFKVHPIILESQSSSFLTEENVSTKFMWNSNGYFISITTPYYITKTIKLPIDLKFWFGNSDTRLSATSIRSLNPDNYQVYFSTNKYQGGLVQIKQKDLNNIPIASNVLLSGLNISMEFVDKFFKHEIEIIFTPEKSKEKDHLLEYHITKSYRYIWSKILYTFIVLTISIGTIAYIKIFRFKNKIQVEKINSPFRKLNTIKC